MNYAKVIASALQLFPQKINITLIESGSEKLIGRFKVPSAVLPTAFDRPTTLLVNNVYWRVMAARPLSADDFLYSRKLQLHVLPVTGAAPDRYYWPTRSGEVPLVEDAVAPAGSLPVTVDRREWMQWQFLPLQQSSVVDEALANIRSVLDGQANPLLGYEQQYVRTGIGQPGLSIPWERLLAVLNHPVHCPLVAETGQGVKDGFCVRSDSYTYYGIVCNGLIDALGITGMEYVDEELMNVMGAFGLQLVDWCRVSRISAEAGEQPPTEQTDL